MKINVDGVCINIKIVIVVFPCDNSKEPTKKIKQPKNTATKKETKESNFHVNLFTFRI